MLKFHLFLFLVIVTIVSGNDSKGFFYKATKNQEVIYLFGDMKYKCGEMNPLNKIMIESFKESEIVIFRWAKTIENSDKIIEDNKYKVVDGKVDGKKEVYDEKGNVIAKTITQYSGFNEENKPDTVKFVENKNIVQINTNNILINSVSLCKKVFCIARKKVFKT